MSRPRTIQELSATLECPPALIARAVRRTGDFPSTDREYRFSEVSRGLALLALDGEKATRRDALRKVCESATAMFASIAKLAECFAFKITTTPSRREGAQTGIQNQP